MADPWAQVADAGPTPSAVPYTLPAATSAATVLIPDRLKGKFVKFRSKGGVSSVRFSDASAFGSVTAVDPTATTAVNGSTGALTANGDEPHQRIADGVDVHIRLDASWTYFSYLTDASTTLDVCEWTGDSN